jgi:hypothetical protein
MSRFKPLAFSILAVFAAGLCLLSVPCLQKVRDGDPSGESRYVLRNLALALHNYHDAYKRLPPAVVTDKQGKPLYSWRVLLLPFLEQKRLYQQFRLDEPWDREHNKQFLKETPRCYRPLWGTNDGPGLTRYQVFVGPGTPFEKPGLTLKPADFPDGLDKTLLVVEGGKPVPWSKPEELVYDPKGPLPSLGGVFQQPVHFLCYPVEWRPGFNAAFADANARFIRADLDEAVLRALVTRNGGEEVDVSSLE